MTEYPEFAGIVLCHGSHFFLIQRSTSSRHWPLYWGFPGGKKEDDEDIKTAACREMQEETGVYIAPEALGKSIQIEAKYIDGVRKAQLFLVKDWIGEPENLEPNIHKNIGWFTLDELPEPVIPHVKEGLL
jgi:8-oxo-dGTP diphosphatase